MLFIRQFIWDESNIAHIARHHVTIEEVEEVFDSLYHLRRMWQNRYTALGRTHAGRYLFVAFDYSREEVYTVTARSMSNKEKRFYQKEMRR